LEKVFGPEHPETATSLNNLTHLLQEQGDLAAARPLYERALVIREKVLGGEHPDTGDEPQQSCQPAEGPGLPVAARPLYERPLAIDEKVHPKPAGKLFIDAATATRLVLRPRTPLKTLCR
jgi:hypothetical protein